MKYYQEKWNEIASRTIGLTDGPKFSTRPRLRDLHPRRGIDNYLTRLANEGTLYQREPTEDEVSSATNWFVALLAYHSLVGNPEVSGVSKHFLNSPIEIAN